MENNSQNTFNSISQTLHSYMDKLIDWKEFELFVADIYRGSDEISVQHNVTLTGRSGAKRQVDVLVTQKVKVHEIQIFIECKSWKDKIDRAVVDVLAGALDDFPGSKGVIFTTKGYEEGAIHLAKAKNIDIFIIRDVYQEEWGDPGRLFELYLQVYASNIMGLRFGSPVFLSTSGKAPSQNVFNFSIVFQPDMEFDEGQYFYSLDGQRGLHLVKILLDIKAHQLKELSKSITGLISMESGISELAIKTPVVVHFQNSPFRYFKIPEGLVKIDSVNFDLLQTITQDKVQFDRAGSSDFVLMVENYVTRQRNFLSRKKGEDSVVMSDVLKEKSPEDQKEILKSGSIAKVLTEYYVNATPNPLTKIVETEILNVNFAPPTENTALK